MAVIPYSSLQARLAGESLGRLYLADRLKGAVSYDRIAGYFASSLLEVAGEELEAVEGEIRIVCNGALQGLDVRAAKYAEDRARVNGAMRTEWMAEDPEERGRHEEGLSRFQRLARLLAEGRLKVRVVPDQVFGFIHGKMGVLRYKDGRAVAFNGSVNESKTAWTLNYEILWEDDAEATVEWAQQEFNLLWEEGIPLSQAVIESIKSIANRETLKVLGDWREVADTPGRLRDTLGAVTRGMPLNNGIGLQDHQKYFIRLAFEYHVQGGARLILADQVGLGKTLQLAVFAVLAALYSNKPVLILVPKALQLQWFEEVKRLLAVPCAYWAGSNWVLEDGTTHQGSSLSNWPRRIGLVSTGLIDEQRQAYDQLAALEYAAVCLDEAHNARGKVEKGRLNLEESPQLFRFLYQVANRNTPSLILATGTPVQLELEESWALLSLLSRGKAGQHVLGDGRWPQDAEDSIKYVLEGSRATVEEQWEWFKNPMPRAVAYASAEHRLRIDLSQIARLQSRGMANGPFHLLSSPDQSVFRRISATVQRLYNPFLLHIVFRTRDFLEKAGHLPRISVDTGGDSDDEAINPTPLHERAFGIAEEFAKAVGKFKKGHGFLSSLLLRRLGSSVRAAQLTAERMLKNRELNEDDLEGLSMNGRGFSPDELAELSAIAMDALSRFKTVVEQIPSDPKYDKVTELLFEQRWVEDGAILFSEFRDTAAWYAEQLSREYPDLEVPLYSSNTESCIYRNGKPDNISRDKLKHLAEQGRFQLLFGTNAASEGLNLQRFGCVINLDLPWAPSKLTQRLGRIRRIGQPRSAVRTWNLRYRGSVEEKVYSRLSRRFKDQHELFGVLPEALEVKWAKELMEGEPDTMEADMAELQQKQHAFKEKYERPYSEEELYWDESPLELAAGALRKGLEG